MKRCKLAHNKNNKNEGKKTIHNIYRDSFNDDCFLIRVNFVYELGTIILAL